MKEYKVIGTFTDSNFGGIEILEIDESDESVLFRWNHGEPEKATRAKLNSNSNGDLWFMSRGIRRKLSDFIRLN